MRWRFAPRKQGLTFLTLASQPRDSTALYSFRHQSRLQVAGYLQACWHPCPHRFSLCVLFAAIGELCLKEYIFQALTNNFLHIFYACVFLAKKNRRMAVWMGVWKRQECDLFCKIFHKADLISLA
jgi:hypothetical protein